MTKYSSEQLIKLLKNFYTYHDVTNISKKMLDSDTTMPSSTTYKRFFGSWNKALHSADLETGIIPGRPYDEPIYISDTAIEIFEGELLGDGGLELTPTSNNPGFAHSTANFCYSEFLENALIAENILIHSEILPPRNGGKEQRRIRTKYNQSFKSLFNRWYPNNTKIAPNDLTLNKLKILHWYLGDGYIENKIVKFSTCGFKWDEVENLSTKMNSLGFKSIVQKHSGGYPVLKLYSKSSRDLINWLGNCPVKGYEYKFNFNR